MANKRMFSLSVVDTDKFLEMPISSRLLYYELGMRADDDGFVDNWKKILLFTGLKEDDMKVLISKQFILPFETGVIVIRHWRLNNYLQKDRTKPTIYQKELKQLELDNNNVYNMYTNCIHSIDKNRIDKNSIDKKKENNKKKKKYFENEEVNNIFIEFLELRKKLRVVNTDRAINLLLNKLNKYDDDIKIQMLEQSIMNSWKSVYELKNKEDITPTWFNEEKEEKEEKSDEEYEQFLKNIGRSN